MRRVNTFLYLFCVSLVLSGCFNDNKKQALPPDTEAPVITLTGGNEVSVILGDDYTELGAIVSDNVDTHLTAVVEGTVNTSALGEYTLTYTATDMAGNTAITTRTVHVTMPTQTPFVFTVDILPDSPSELPISYQDKVIIDWGDAGIALNSLTHPFSVEGQYEIKVYGNIAFKFSDMGEAIFYHCEIKQWGEYAFTSMEGMFQHCGETLSIPSDAPNLTNVKSMEEMAANSVFNEDINHWDVSNVETMKDLFRSAKEFNQPLDNWNVAKVTDMSGMFSGAFSFDQPLNTWDVSNVRTMANMFYSSGFNHPIDNWNVSNVESMQHMFNEAGSFNQSLASWDVANVNNMEAMFLRALSFNQPLNDWQVTNVTNMQSMFYFAQVFNQPLNNWDVSKVTHISEMFSYAKAFDQDLSSWALASIEQEAAGLQGFLTGATSFSTANYDKLLTQWPNHAIANNITFDISARFSNSGEVGRDILINQYGWTINDAGKVLEIVK